MFEILVWIGGFGSDIIHPLTAHRIFGEIGAGNRITHPSWFFCIKTEIRPSSYQTSCRGIFDGYQNSEGTTGIGFPGRPGTVV